MEFDNDADTVFRDVFTIALLGFVAIVLLLLPYLNPPTKSDTDTELAPESLVVEIVWGQGLLSDVDLWVQAPGEKPVGYSRKNGRVFNLLRDDLGVDRDSLPVNYEVSYSRGIPDGPYTINVHMYRLKDPAPVRVFVVVSTRASDGTLTRVLTKEVELAGEGQELTVYRFEVRNKKIVPGSVHDLQRSLRGG